MGVEKKNLGSLLADTFFLIKENFLFLMSVVAVVYVPLCALFFLFLGSTFAFKDEIDALVVNKSALVIFLGIVLFIALIVVTFLAVMIFSVAMIKAIKACDEKKDVSLRDLYQLSFAGLGPFCVVILWVFVKVSLWSFLLIVPGVVFALFYSFAQIVFILDGKQGVSALEASRSMIQPYFWEFVGKSFVAGLIFLVVSGIFSFILHYFFPLNAGWDLVFARILENLVNSFLGVFPMTFGYFLYKDLKERGC